MLGYLSDIGSTLSQMERAEAPAEPEWRCRAEGGGGKVELEVERCAGFIGANRLLFIVFMIIGI